MAEEFGLPGGLMDGGETTDRQDSPTLDTGFTFFGQFIDHNVTFDVTGQLGRLVDPEAVQNFRRPLLDLDHLYGSGPVVDPILYDTTSHNAKLMLSPDGVDLARTPAGVPLIGDPRNDENLLLSQLHLAFIKFHNRAVDALAAGEITDVFGDFFPPVPSTTAPPPNASIDQLLAVRTYYDDLFDKAQQIVRWHFQWIIVHEFLPLVAGQDSVDRVNRDGLQFYLPDGKPFILVEFAVAAFRFMHPTIRSEYTINDQHTLSLFPLNFTDPLPPPTSGPTCGAARWRRNSQWTSPISSPSPARSARFRSAMPNWALPGRSTCGTTSSEKLTCATTAAGWGRSGL